MFFIQTDLCWSAAGVALGVGAGELLPNWRRNESASHSADHWRRVSHGTLSLALDSANSLNTPQAAAAAAAGHCHWPSASPPVGWPASRLEMAHARPRPDRCSEWPLAWTMRAKLIVVPTGERVPLCSALPRGACANQPKTLANAHREFKLARAARQMDLGHAAARPRRAPFVEINQDNGRQRIWPS